MDHLEEIRLVEELGSKIGYGNMMIIASALWADTLNYKYGSGAGDNAFIPTIMPYIQDKYKATTQQEIAVARSWVSRYREMYDRKTE